MQNFTTASLKEHRDMEEEILRLQNYINGSRYTVVITGAGISMAAGIMDFAHMNFPLVLQMSSSAVMMCRFGIRVRLPTVKNAEV